ncbi:MAG TPA: DUF2339 domain-containing protein [Caulobacteraceae bacterium]|nr:DUF2339 domain-containing protein [Caulobacteraceae bacterium]
MIWFVVFALGVWVAVVQTRLFSVEARLRSVERRPAQAPADDRRQSTASVAHVSASAATAPAAAPAQSAETALQAIPGRSERVDDAEASVAASVANELAQTLHGRASVPRTSFRDQAATWLGENGLAWAGGGALALGGSFLVAYAAEQGFFTPLLRLIAALALGFSLIGLGEIVRRRGDRPGAHGLVAAILSGAGAATLYAAIWAAYALYSYVSAIPAAALLAAVSAGLLAVALIHGEALGVLAIFGALLAPAVCRSETWTNVALDGYLAGVVGAGLALARQRGWTWVGLGSLVALGLWIMVRLVAGDELGAGGLVVLGGALSLVAAQGGKQIAATARRPAPRQLPLIGICGGQLLWVAMATMGAPTPSLLAAVGVGLIIATASFLLDSPSMMGILLAPALAMATVELNLPGLQVHPGAANSPAWFLAPPLTLAIAGALLARRGPPRAASAAGAAGAALTLTLLSSKLDASFGPAAAALYVGTACVLLGIAEWLARASDDRRTDLSAAAFVAAGAESLGLALHAGLPAAAEPAGYAALGVVLTAVAWRRPTRGLVESSIVAALFAFAALLGRSTAGAVLAGRLGLDVLLAISLPVLALQLANWRGAMRAGAARLLVEALSTVTAATGALIGFLVLRIFASAGGQGGILDGFSEAALRTDMLLVFGLVLTTRSGPSLLSRARGPVLLALGALHMLLLEGVVLNPWWGLDPPTRLAGPPIFDALAVGFLAPTILLGFSGRRLARLSDRLAWPCAALAFVSFILWEVLEVRRLFHGPSLASGAMGYGEAAAYGAAFLVGGFMATRAIEHRLVLRTNPAVGLIGRLVLWAALSLGAWQICVIDSPWWGPIGGPFHGAGVYFGVQMLAVLMTVEMARRAGDAGETVLAETARVLAVLEMLVVCTLLIRFGFHGAEMRRPLSGAGLETWTYSAFWAIFGLASLLAGVRLKNRPLQWLGLVLLLATTAKVFLFDMATLQGVVRAASFLALGLILIGGALATRRLRAAAPAAEASEG